MQLQVKLHGLPPAATLNARIRRQLTRLEHQHRDVETCRVSIDRRPALHGDAERYVVTLEVAVGRRRVQIEGEPSADIGIALREAFDKAHAELLARSGRTVPASELEDVEGKEEETEAISAAPN
jgi:hypothetical protein